MGGACGEVISDTMQGLVNHCQEFILTLNEMSGHLGGVS